MTSRVSRLLNRCRGRLAAAREGLRRTRDRPPFFRRPGDPDTVRAILAYEFKSERRLSEMLALLNGRGPWQWYDRDSAWPVNEISTEVIDDKAVIRIYEEKEGFNLGIYFKTRGPKAEREWDQIHGVVVRDLIPALGAREVTRASAYDPPASWWRAPAVEGPSESP